MVFYILPQLERDILRPSSAARQLSHYITLGPFLACELKPGFHMIVTVGEASPRQARGHIGDGCVKWKHFLNDVADQTGTVRGRIKRVEMSLKPCFHMIVAVIVSICRRLIGDTSPMCRSRSPTVTIIWKPGLTKAWFPYDRNSRRPTATHRRRVPDQSATYGNVHCYDHMETRL